MEASKLLKGLGVNEHVMMESSERVRPRWFARRWLRIVAGTVLLVVVAVGIAAEYVARHAGPIVRKRLIETLSARFHEPVELDRLDISLLKGVEVEGGGLRVPYSADGRALVSVERFTFRTTIEGLLREPTHVDVVQVEGMELHIPPGGMGGVMAGQADPTHPKTKAKIAFTVGQILCTHVKLVIDTTKPGKEPLEFDIGRLDLHDVGPGQAMRYEAELINPKPVGGIHVTGHFGPWNAEEPRATALDGEYHFENADLSTIKGIGGTLSSVGSFTGQLQRLTVDGTTRVPDFWVDVSQHPVPLETRFHAYVDGTDGDTTLDPVQARLLHTDFTCRGSVVRVKGAGHDISLDVEMPNGRIEDMLMVGVKTRPPLMRGALTMRAKLHIPPGHERVIKKMGLVGTFSIRNVEFSNAGWQDKVDDLSLRAQGRPEDAREAGRDRKAEVSSMMSAGIDLGGGVMLVKDLTYTVPGATVAMNGVYSTDGDLFEFKGHVRTQAEASQMVTGWKSLVLMPFDKMLQKHGAGLELPIEIHGAQGDMHFGLAMHGGADETPQQIEAEMRAKAAERRGEGR